MFIIFFLILFGLLITRGRERERENIKKKEKGKSKKIKRTIINLKITTIEPNFVFIFSLK